MPITPGGTRQRVPTFPNYHTLRRHKPRRWPLVLRITKGSVHLSIMLPVLFHMAFSTLVALLHTHGHPVAIPPGSIVPSLSIVVGLMLVFRNSSSYDRFWTGRTNLASVVSCTRCLVRYILAYARNDEAAGSGMKKMERPNQPTVDLSNVSHTAAPGVGHHGSNALHTRPYATYNREIENRDTESTIRLLIAMLYAVKHSLRAEFANETEPTAPGTPYPMMAGDSTPTLAGGGASSTNGGPAGDMSASQASYFSEHTLLNPSAGPQTFSAFSKSTIKGVYADMHLQGVFGSNGPIPSLEDRGVALPVSLSIHVEGYIRRGVQRGWWAAPQAGMLSSVLTQLISNFAAMETIRSTPLPVAHLIHSRQVLALYLMVLPFAMVAEMGWVTILVVALVSFTLYGIESIGAQLEDPFGYDKNDIKMDAIVLDAREEIEALVEEWKARGCRW